MIRVAFFDTKAYDKPSFEQYGSRNDVEFEDNPSSYDLLSPRYVLLYFVIIALWIVNFKGENPVILL